MTTTGKSSTGKQRDDLLVELSRELDRLDANDVQLSLDVDFEPEAGTLLRVEIGLAFWHLLPEEFRTIVADIQDGAGSEAIKKAIETHAVHVWHGPSPKQTRDTSP